MSVANDVRFVGVKQTCPGSADTSVFDPELTLGTAQRAMPKVVPVQFRSDRVSVRSSAGDKVAELVAQMVLT
jgi:hypothetical protein